MDAVSSENKVPVFYEYNGWDGAPVFLWVQVGVYERIRMRINDSGPSCPTSDAFGKRKMGKEGTYGGI